MSDVIEVAVEAETIEVFTSSEVLDVVITTTEAIEITTPGPGVARFIFTQSTPATVWTIPHNLGYWPVVRTYTVGGAWVLGSELHLNTNTTQVTFQTPMAGIASCV